MKKRVYLQELDSVLSSDNCVKKAMYAMFEEIVINGNIVVLSLNQITDSRWFLSMLSDEKMYEVLLFLFDNGHLQISRFGEYKTPSQYIQMAIEKNLEKNGSSFLFSALPLKTTQRFLLNITKNALAFADLSELYYYKETDNDLVRHKIFEETLDLDYSQTYAGNTTKELSNNEELDASVIERERIQLELIIKFVRLVISTSIKMTSLTPVCDYVEGSECPPIEFFDFYNVISNCCYEGEKSDVKLAWDTATSILKQVAESNDDFVHWKNNRSDWIKHINKIDKEETGDGIAMAVLILDLIYNYTVEYSVFGSSKHYNVSNLRKGDTKSFVNDFFYRLEIEWSERVVEDYSTRLVDNSLFEIYKGDRPNWEIGHRILKLRAEDKSNNSKEIQSYEKEIDSQRKEQRKINRKVFLTTVSIAAVSIASLIALDLFVGYVQDKGFVHFNYLGNSVVSSFLTVTLFLLVTQLAERLIPQTDIIKCLYNIISNGKDIAYLKKIKGYSYCRSNVEDMDLHPEKLPNSKTIHYTITTEIRKYMELYKHRREFFAESSTIPIVDPITNTDMLLEYQIRTGKKIGVVFSSDYHIMIVDLINSETHYTYERLMPTIQKGAVVIVPVINGKYVLLEQYRHAIRKKQISFPRGFAEMDDNNSMIESSVNAVKELREEIGACMIGNPEFIGNVYADSGILGTKVSVYKIEIDDYDENSTEEGIVSIMTVDDTTLKRMIMNNEIDDGYTLAACSLISASTGCM